MKDTEPLRFDQDDLSVAARWIRSAQALLVTAGAGIGVDSGLPDFRGPEGFWAAYPALRSAGLGFVDIASPSRFKGETGRLAWGFYGHRLDMYRHVAPHAGFDVLRRWAERMARGAWVFTSNVDGHFQQAGFPRMRVHECHGSIHELQCLVPCCQDTWSADEFVPEVDSGRCLLVSEPPRCPWCGGPARPNILMFNDYAWVEGPAEASRARLDAWCRSVGEILVIEVGAGTEIPTVRRFGERVGSRFIRINLREHEAKYPRNAIGLAGTALEVLTELDRRVGW